MNSSTKSKKSASKLPSNPAPYLHGQVLLPGRAAKQFCWHLRVGFYREIDPQRMKEYACFFYKVCLNPHLEQQGNLLALMPEISPDVLSQAKTYHRKFRKLFVFDGDSTRTLGIIEEWLERYTRFQSTILSKQYFNGTLISEQKEWLTDNEGSIVNQLANYHDPYWELE